jgi:hypothetical protein
MPESDVSEPWGLLPSEVVCPVCWLAHHKHLPACPTCVLEDRL